MLGNKQLIKPYHMKKILEKLSVTDMRSIIALTTVAGIFVILAMLMFHPIPETNKDIVNSIISAITGGALGGVIGFYFGSKKQELTQEK